VPIRENGVTWPDGSDVLASVRVVQEYTTIVAVSVDAVIVAGVVGIGDVDGRVDNARNMLVNELDG
jgi:hypothetical protein